MLLVITPDRQTSYLKPGPAEWAEGVRFITAKKAQKELILLKLTGKGSDEIQNR